MLVVVAEYVHLVFKTTVPENEFSLVGRITLKPLPEGVVLFLQHLTFEFTLQPSGIELIF